MLTRKILERSKIKEKLKMLALLYETRISLNGCVTIAGGVQEKELNAQTKHCSAKHEM